MAEDNKKIVNIEILHLDEIGYGPAGKHTRREWRAECLKYLQLGKESDFLLWQQSLPRIKYNNREQVDFSLTLNFSDGTTEQRKYLNSPVALDFLGQTFANDLNVAGYNFLQYAQFNFAIFEGRAWFNKANFKSDAMFSKAIFKLDAWFKHVSFNGDAVFSNATFRHDALFHDATFNKGTIFSECVFESDVVFCDASFMSDVIFNKTTFKGDWNHGKTDFRDVYFHGNADFDAAVFECDARFQEAIFEGNVIFDWADFVGNAWFEKVKFESRSMFIGVKFQGEAVFENARFNNVGHFESATFNAVTSKIPSFRGCQIDGTRLEFSDDTHFTKQDFTEDAIKNISFLKRLSDEHGQTDQALNFNAMELRAKRRFEFQNLSANNHKDADALSGLLSWRAWIRLGKFFKGNFWFWFFTLLYEKCSDFGRSFTRPLFLLIALNAITFLLCLYVANSNTTNAKQPAFSGLSEKVQLSDEISISAFRAATEYSLYKTGNFLDFSDSDKRTEIINQCLFGSVVEPSSMRFYGFFKGLISAILIFLIGLGIRNKYRVS